MTLPPGPAMPLMQSQPLKQQPVTQLELLANWPAALGGEEGAKQ